MQSQLGWSGLKFESSPKLTLETNGSAHFYLLRRQLSSLRSAEPYDSNPAENLRKSITLQVNVPVLSEKIYSTQPNSSFKLELWTFVGRSFSSEYICQSHPMNFAWENFTISSETSRLMGTMLVNSKIQVPKDCRNSFVIVQAPQLEGSGMSRYQVLESFTRSHTTTKEAAHAQQMHIVRKTYRIWRPVCRSKFDCFCLEAQLLSIIRVLGPT